METRCHTGKVKVNKMGNYDIDVDNDDVDVCLGYCKGQGMAR